MIIDYESVINKLAADLDDRVLRSQLIASNIANVDTPGYKAKEVKFERVLSDSMDSLKLKQTHVKHLSDLEAASGAGNEIVENPNPGRPDGNNVNIDEEMLKLTENNIKYNVAVQFLSKRLTHIRNAIQESK